MLPFFFHMNLHAEQVRLLHLIKFIFESVLLLLAQLLNVLSPRVRLCLVRMHRNNASIFMCGAHFQTTTTNERRLVLIPGKHFFFMLFTVFMSMATSFIHFEFIYLWNFLKKSFLVAQ